MVRLANGINRNEILSSTNRRSLAIETYNLVLKHTMSSHASNYRYAVELKDLTEMWRNFPRVGGDQIVREYTLRSELRLVKAVAVNLIKRVHDVGDDAARTAMGTAHLDLYEFTSATLDREHPEVSWYMEGNLFNVAAGAGGFDPPPRNRWLVDIIQNIHEEEALLGRTR
eukprot:TCONS_00036389-protein